MDIQVFILGLLILLTGQVYFFILCTVPRELRDLERKIANLEIMCNGRINKAEIKVEEAIFERVVNSTGQYLTDIYTSCIKCGGKMRPEEAIHSNDKTKQEFKCIICLHKELKDLYILD